MDLKELIFQECDLELKQVPVRMGSRCYVLLQVSQAARAEHKNMISRGIRVDSEGTPLGIDGMGNADTFLLSLCLYEAGPDGALVCKADGIPDEARRVPPGIIGHWPDGVVEKLLATLKHMSRLDEKPSQQQERAKNGQGATPGSSA